MDAVREWLRQANSVAVLTGAGVSAESGVPTFRGNNGLWKQRRPEDLATPGAFARNPELVWEWYDWRRSVLAQANPNPRNYNLAEIKKRVSNITFITQNANSRNALPRSRNLL